ncbi:MAG: VOC family protein [Pseudomonadota bacterium]
MLRNFSKLSLLLALLNPAFGESELSPDVYPIHLDDIHFIVTDEAQSVSFFETHFDAREMAHPGERFDLVRFLSVKWHDPTITITRTGPYADLPPERNARWQNVRLVPPDGPKTKAFYGVRWLALATPSLDQARKKLLANGAVVSENAVSLPMEPTARAFSIYGPDGAALVIVERPQVDFGSASFAIDHIQFLTADRDKSARFFMSVFGGSPNEKTEAGTTLKVADATIVLSEPKAFEIDPDDVSLRNRPGTVHLGIDHLGFLYENIQDAVDAAAEQGYKPLFPPTRYVYKGKPTLYTFTAFSSPDNVTIEMVQVDGRIGPHSYYD